MSISDINHHQRLLHLNESKHPYDNMNWSSAFEKYLSNLNATPPPILPPLSLEVAPLHPSVLLNTTPNENVATDPSNALDLNQNLESNTSSPFKLASSSPVFTSYINSLSTTNNKINYTLPSSNQIIGNKRLHSSFAEQDSEGPEKAEGSSSNTESSQPEEKICFPCCWDLCTQVFSTRTGLATHCSSHLALYLPFSSTGNKKQKVAMPCRWRDCSVIVHSLKDLAKHMAEDSHIGQTPFLSKEYEDENAEKVKKKKKYACSFPSCGRLFADSSNRKKHERTHDANRERFYCSESGCTKSYSTKTDLNIHMKAHKGEFPHKCTFPNCNKVFVRLSELYAHERSHDNILPHLCTVCGKRFREKSRLRQHEETHTNNSPNN